VVKTEINLETHIVAGTDRGGEDLMLDISIQAYGLGDSDEHLHEFVTDHLEAKVQRSIVVCDKESEYADATDVEGLREELGREDGLVFFRGAVYFPETPHYEQTDTKTYVEFVRLLMENLTDLSAWEHLRRFGQGQHHWNFERSIFICGNAE
jgi:hypothetical protein